MDGVEELRLTVVVLSPSASAKAFIHIRLVAWYLECGMILAMCRSIKPRGAGEGLSPGVMRAEVALGKLVNARLMREATRIACVGPPHPSLLSLSLD